MVCCLLFVSVDGCSLFVVRSSLRVACCMMMVVCLCVVFVACYGLFVARCSL